MTKIATQDLRGVYWHDVFIPKFMLGTRVNWLGSDGRPVWRNCKIVRYERYRRGRRWRTSYTIRTDVGNESEKWEQELEALGV